MTLMTLHRLVDRQCCNLVSNVCLGVGLVWDRFREDRGECWVKNQLPCKFFTKCVLPLSPELTDDYIQITGDTAVD